MANLLRIDEVEYDEAMLPPGGQLLVGKLRFVQARLQELMNQRALLYKAKNAYIADLKIEIVEGCSGVDLGEMFSDD
jgi:hypothetical protein